MLSGLLDVHNDVGKDTQCVIVPSCHQITEPNVVMQADLASRHSGVGQHLNRRGGGHKVKSSIAWALLCAHWTGVNPVAAALSQDSMHALHSA